MERESSWHIWASMLPRIVVAAGIGEANGAIAAEYREAVHIREELYPGQNQLPSSALLVKIPPSKSHWAHACEQD